MKTVKMSLANIQGKLSRNEMKNVIGGNSVCACDKYYNCVCGPDSCSVSGSCIVCKSGVYCAVPVK